MRREEEPVADASAECPPQMAVVRPTASSAPTQTALEEHVWRALIETSPDAVFVLDSGNSVLLCNREALRACSGGEEQRLKGRDALSLFVPEDRARAAANLSRARVRGDVRHLEFGLLRSDGTRFPAEVSASFVAGSAGQPEALVLNVRDVAEQRRASEEQARLHAAVRQSALEWRRTFDSIQSLVLMLDFQGNVVRLNQAARTLASRTFQEIVRRPLRALGQDQPWQAIGELHARIARERSSAASQVSDAKAGRTWDLTGSLSGGEEGLPSRIIVIVRDVTDMVALQTSLRRNETMSVMGSLVAGVAHEVRNPLHVITATLDAFEARFGAREEFGRYLGAMRGELERLTRLMRELLAYGRPSAPTRELAPLAAVAADAVRACAPQARRQKVKLMSLVSDELAAPMDCEHMLDALRNLIENAVQHSPAGATVSLEARRVEEAGRQWLECAVCDEGVGFEAADLVRVFEPFFTRRRGGTGLGLSVVQRVVEQHGGSVRAQNRAGGGGRVSLLLPII